MELFSSRFKAVKGYEGLYEINEKGEVWSLPRTTSLNGGKRKIAGHFMTLVRQPSRADRYVCLSKNGKSKTFGVSHLIAEAFKK